MTHMLMISNHLYTNLNLLIESHLEYRLLQRSEDQEPDELMEKDRAVPRYDTKKTRSQNRFLPTPIIPPTLVVSVLVPI